MCAIGKPCPTNLLLILERLRAIRELNLAAAVLEELPLKRQQSLSREGMRVATQNLRLFSDARRYAVMAVTLLDLQKALVDDALDMHDRIMTRVLRQGKQRQAESPCNPMPSRSSRPWACSRA